MSIAQFALAEASIAQSAVKEASRKAPPKRVEIAQADVKLVAEPR